MPFNVLLTAGLSILLAIVLVKRRQMAARPSSGGARKRGTDDEAPRAPRIRPKLGMAVPTALPDDSLSIEPDQTSGHQLLGSPTTAPEVPEVPWSPAPASTETGGAVEAPGWPTPGELSTGFGFDEFDPLPPAPDDPGHTESAAAEDSADAFDYEAAWDLPDEDDPDPAPDTPAPWMSISDEPIDPETETTEQPVATLTEPADDWDASQWNWESTSDEAVSELELEHAEDMVPDEPSPEWDSPAPGDAGAPDSTVQWTDPSPEPARWDDDTESTIQAVDVVVTHVESATGHAETVGFEQQEPAVVDAVRPVLASAIAAGNQSPVVVVVTTPGQSSRERELEQRVRELEAQLAVLTNEVAPVRRTTNAPRSTTPARAQSRSGRARTTATTAPRALRLTAVETTKLRELAARRSAPAAARQRARIVLAIAKGQPVAAIAERLGVSTSTVRRWQARFAEERLRAIPELTTRTR